MRQRKKSKGPVILAADINAAAVVQDAENYRHLLDIAARADAAEGLRQGFEDATHGRTRSAKEFFDEFETQNAIPPRDHAPR